MILQPSLIHPTQIRYLFREITQWRYGRSRWPVQIWCSRQSLWATSICPLHDGHRLLVGTVDGTVRMQNLESACHSRCTKNNCILALRKDGGYKIMAVCLHWIAGYNYLGACNAWGYWAPVWHRGRIFRRWQSDSCSLITICDILYPENRLSFDPWPKGRRVCDSKVAFQTCNELVICARLRGDDSDELSGLLQVWKVKDHSERAFSLDINSAKYLTYTWHLMA